MENDQNMMMDTQAVRSLIQDTIHAHVSPGAQARRIEALAMGETERGWSGAEIRRWRVTLEKGEPLALITKTMPLKERRVMHYLTRQGHANVPFTHAADLTSNGPVMACMQDLGSQRIGLPGSDEPAAAATGWEEQVASSLAAIHLGSLGKQAALDWLPRADAAYARDFLVREVWRVNWDDALRGSADFAREFDRYTPLLEQAAEKLVRAVDALWQEGDALTLTHGEVHGEHVMIYQDRPYFIDWGWTYYGPLYLDLPAFFTPANAQIYRRALEDQGLRIPEQDFNERYREIGRYVGFKYLCSGIWLWGQGPTSQTGRRLLMTIRWAIDGTWPERAFAVPARAWARLFDAHTTLLTTGFA